LASSDREPRRRFSLAKDYEKQSAPLDITLLPGAVPEEARTAVSQNFRRCANFLVLEIENGTSVTKDDRRPVIFAEPVAQECYADTGPQFKNSRIFCNAGKNFRK
jgi:hypothetical protein